MVEISTSLLNVKKEDASRIIYGLEVAHTDYFHIDVMDGKFVPKDTTKMMKEYTNTVKQISNIPLDVHLMVEDVKSFIDEYIGFKPNIITFHVEAVKTKEEIKELIDYIKNSGIKVRTISKAKNKNRRNIWVFTIHTYVSNNDSRTRTWRTKTNARNDRQGKNTKRICRQKQIRHRHRSRPDGIKTDNIEEVKRAGANIFVVGTAIVESENMEGTIETLRND